MGDYTPDAPITALSNGYGNWRLSHDGSQVSVRMNGVEFDKALRIAAILAE